MMLQHGSGRDATRAAASGTTPSSKLLGCRRSRPSWRKADYFLVGPSPRVHRGRRFRCMNLGVGLNQGVWAVSWRLYAARATAFLGEPAFSQLGRGPLPRSTRTVETGNRSRRSPAAPCAAVYPPGAPQGAAKAPKGKSACERISERSIINHTVTVSFERYNVGYTHFPWSMHLEQTVARVGRDPGARRTTDARISSVSRVDAAVRVRSKHPANEHECRSMRARLPISSARSLCPLRGWPPSRPSPSRPPSSRPSPSLDRARPPPLPSSIIGSMVITCTGA